jgi:hypothetical protein
MIPHEGISQSLKDISICDTYFTKAAKGEHAFGRQFTEQGH